MAVPTIYAKLIAAYDAADAATRRRWSDGAGSMRLMVSGSAALPVSVLERWEAVTGQRLLERYGMTELGMALSNPYRGERRAGSVGLPLPGVEARLADEQGNAITEENTPGQIQVRGSAVFREYWQKPDATAEAFDNDGWFHTGDIAQREDRYYRILGRSSVDIIKTGGYKVSALEIEEVLRTHPAVGDCAVVGVPDEEWGEAVCTMLVPKADADRAALDIKPLRAWMKEQLASYKAPKAVELVEDLPRNAMGKVVKPRVREAFVASGDG